MELGPPPAPTIFSKDAGLGFTQTVLSVVLVAFAAQESFHGISGMYPRADSLPGPFGAGGVIQKFACVPTSSKSVPPTATLKGVDAKPLTARPRVAALAVLKLSHPAEPGSPEDTITVMPCAAACSQSALKKLLPDVPKPASQRPKLKLITGAMLLSMM